MGREVGEMRNTEAPHCTRCGFPLPEGAAFCPRCGEPRAVTIASQLRDYYAALRLLDRSIGEGRGLRTVDEVRKEYAAQAAHLSASLGQPTAQTAATSAPASPGVTPLSPVPSQGTGALPSNAANLMQRVYAGQAASVPPNAAKPSAPRLARGFSFQVFLAEQAVALTAYVAIFLLLAATLLYVVAGATIGQGNGLAKGRLDSLHLVVTIVVYLAMVGGGIGLRRWAGLRVVGQAALVMSVLMLPLVALAIYLSLPASAPVTANQILLLSACYGAAIYLLLAWRIHSGFFSYLGSASAVTAALAVLPSLPGNPPVEWQAFVLALAAMGLLAGHLVISRRVRARLATAPSSEAKAALADLQRRVVDPAAYVALFTTLVAFLWCEGLLYISVQITLAAQPMTISQAAFAAASIALVGVALLWYAVVGVRPVRGQALILEVDAGLIAGLSAQAIAALASAISRDVGVVSVVMAVEAFVGTGSAVALRRVWPRRQALRHVVEGISLLLSVVSVLFVLPQHGWLLSLALVAGAGVTVGIAILEDAPWWLLGTGFAASLAYGNALTTLAYTPAAEVLSRPTFFLALTAAYWTVELVLTLRPATRRFGLPLYVVALGNAVYVLLLLPFSGHAYSAGYATAIVTALAVLAYLAAYFEERPRLAAIATGAFGVLLPLPVLIQSFDTTSAARVAMVGGLCALTLGVAVVGLALRRVLGRAWVYAPYGVALWLAVVAAGAAELYGITLGPWNLASPLLLAVAVLATVASLAERSERWGAWTMVIPATLAVAATLTSRNALTEVGLVYAMVVIAQSLRRVGRGWSVSWYLAALLCSPLSVIHVAHTPPVAGTPLAGAAGSAILLALYALTAYLIAAQIRWPALTALGSVYGGAAVAEALVAWGPHATLAVALVAAGVGLGIRLRFGWRWAFSVYTIATWAAILTGASYIRSPVTDCELLLLFAALAYLLGQVEATPWPSTLALPFVGWTLVVEPDQRLALGLLVGCVALGMALGRRTEAKRSLPIYLVAAVAGLGLLIEQESVGARAGVLFLEAGLAYLVAAVELWAGLVPVALALGAVAVWPLGIALGWDLPRDVFAYLGLSWLYAGGQLLWPVVEAWHARLAPATPTTGNTAASGEQAGTGEAAGGQPTVATSPATRSVGVAWHQWGAVATGLWAALLSLDGRTTFDASGAASFVPSVAMLSVAVMLYVYSRQPRLHVLLYISGEFVSVALALATAALLPGHYTAILLIPGLYQLAVGAALPVDAKLPEELAKEREMASVIFSLAGCALVLTPPFVESFSPGASATLYIPLLVVEALAILGGGLVGRTRVLVLVGAAALVLAAGRAVLVALASGSAANLIIAVFALAFVLLSGLAVWLSYNRRAQAG